MKSGITAPRFNYDPDFAVAPGATLLETIDGLGIDQKELAQRTGFTDKHINLVIHGKAPISSDAAIRFESVTGVPASMWNNLEANYRARLAGIEAKEQLKHDLDWLKCIPVNELIKRGVIPDTTDRVERLQYVLRFFRVASVAAWKKGWSSHGFSFRKSVAVESKMELIACWLRLCEIEAAKIETASYDESSFRSCLKEIRKLTTVAPQKFIPQIVELARATGVSVVFVPEIRGAAVSGAAKWLTTTKPMIAVNLRGKANDRFWFTFFHEAAHILLGSKQQAFIDIDYRDDPDEQEANAFAAKTLIPPKYNFRLPELLTATSVKRFAQEISIHPGIVVGRLQWDKIVSYKFLNELKDKYDWSA